MPIILTLRKSSEVPAQPLLRLDRGEIVVGRGADATVAIADPAISRRHCAIDGEGAAWRIADAGSSGGTFVNGQPLTEPRPLRHGDVIGVGASEIEVALEAAAGETATTARDAWGRPPPSPSPIDPGPVGSWQSASAPDAPAAAGQGGVTPAVVHAAALALTRLAEDRRKARVELGVAAPGEPAPAGADELARQLSAAAPAEAAARIDQLYREIDAHQRALLGAMQAGLSAALDQFAPAAIKRARGEAEAWRAYEKAFAASDGFVETFAQAFARHYARGISG